MILLQETDSTMQEILLKQASKFGSEYDKGVFCHVKIDFLQVAGNDLFTLCEHKKSIR